MNHFGNGSRGTTGSVLSTVDIIPSIRKTGRSGPASTTRRRKLPAALISLVMVSALVGLSILQMAFSAPASLQIVQEVGQSGSQGTELELSYLPPHITGSYHFRA